MQATHILYYAAQPPPLASQSACGTCRVCGATDTPGTPFNAWVRDTFTNHDQLRPGEVICEICQFAFAQGSEFLAARVGKDKPQRMQNYSHLVLHGVWHPLHKGQKAEILSLLRQSPELASIGTSGQKHVVFRTRPGWWQVEEQGVLPNLDALDACLGLVDKFYRVFNKEEIATGNYGSTRTLTYAQNYGFDDYLSTEAAIRQWRGLAHFDLALYLAQKEEVNEERNSRLDGLPATVSSSITDVNPTLARSGTGLQTEVRSQHLGAIRRQHPRRGLHEQSEQVLQHSLFETGDRLDGK